MKNPTSIIQGFLNNYARAREGINRFAVNDAYINLRLSRHVRARTRDNKPQSEHSARARGNSIRSWSATSIPLECKRHLMRIGTCCILLVKKVGEVIVLLLDFYIIQLIRFHCRIALHFTQATYITNPQVVTH